MATILFTNISNGHFKHKGTNVDDYTETLIHYLSSEGTPWSYLYEPHVKDSYTPGNYYFTRRDDLYLYIAEDHYLDDEDPENEFKPTILLLNSMLGITLAFHYLRTNKVQEFTMSVEDKSYKFSGPNIQPIIVDPNAGNLYNHVVPRIVARRLNGVFRYDLCPACNPECNSIHLFTKLLEKQYAQELFITLHGWSNRLAGVHDRDPSIIFDGIRIKSFGNHVDISLKKENNYYSSLLTITKESLLKFLQAWDSRLQFCDTFTLVFLGNTLRFFEGEPL